MPSLNLFLGIDLGTTSVKATLINEQWEVAGQQRVEYKTIQIKPAWAEQDPLEWWAATCQAVKQLLILTMAEAKQIKAVSVSSHAPTLLGLDRDGNPTGNAIIWMDRRANKQCEETLGLMSDTITGYSGNRIDPYYMLPKLLWEMQNYKEKYDSTYRYLQANGWIVYQLTNRYSIDRTSAALTQLYNIHQDCWETAVMKELSIDMHKLPPVFDCMDIVGTVSDKAAEAVGLPSGIPVIAGAIDGATAPLGLKLFESTQAFEMSGQSSGIGVIIDQPIYHPNLCLLKHAVLGKWILKGSMSTSGGSLKWFRDQIDEKPGSAEAYNRYDRLVEKVPAGSNGLIFLPYLAGERAPLWDNNVRGMFFGLHLQTSKPDMLRAIMEGTAFGLKSILQEFSNANIEVKELFGTGGGYLSDVWSQMKADILEKRISARTGDVETASLGSAYLAHIAVTGISPDKIPEAGAVKEYTPNTEKQNLYGSYYTIFKNLYSANRSLFQDLSLAGDRV